MSVKLTLKVLWLRLLLTMLSLLLRLSLVNSRLVPGLLLLLLLSFGINLSSLLTLMVTPKVL